MGRKSERLPKEGFEPTKNVLEPYERQETADFGRGDYAPKRGYTPTSVAQSAIVRAGIPKRQSPRNPGPAA